MFNRRNTGIWAVANPHNCRQTNFQERFGFNVWCGLIGSKILGPYIFHSTLTGERYQQFLQEVLVEYLGDLPLELRREIYFMQDGAPSHNARQNMETLKEMFPQRLIATNGNIKWPARSPDLTPMDFFLWGRLKDNVYQSPVLNEADLRTRLDGAIVSIGRSEIYSSVKNVIRRCQMCLGTNGENFEHLL